MVSVFSQVFKWANSKVLTLHLFVSSCLNNLETLCYRWQIKFCWWTSIMFSFFFGFWIHELYSIICFILFGTEFTVLPRLHNFVKFFLCYSIVFYCLCIQFELWLFNFGMNTLFVYNLILYMNFIQMKNNEIITCILIILYCELETEKTAWMRNGTPILQFFLLLLFSSRLFMLRQTVLIHKHVEVFFRNIWKSNMKFLL